MLFQMAPWVRYGLEALAYLESLPDRLPEATILEDAPAINGIQIKELLGQPVPDREAVLAEWRERRRQQRSRPPAPWPSGEC